MYYAVTWDNLWWLWNDFPVWHLTTSRKQMQESCQRLQQLFEVAAGCWRGSHSRTMTENALSILIVVFPYNSNKPRPATESCVFSNVVQMCNRVTDPWDMCSFSRPAEGHSGGVIHSEKWSNQKNGTNSKIKFYIYLHLIFVTMMDIKIFITVGWVGAGLFFLTYYYIISSM